MPLDAESEEPLHSPVSTEAFGSFGRLGERRRSQLAQTHTVGDIPKISTTKSPGPGQDDRRRTVLVYRLFSVTVPALQESSGSSDAASNALRAQGRRDSTPNSEKTPTANLQGQTQPPTPYSLPTAIPAPRQAQPERDHRGTPTKPVNAPFGFLNLSGSAIAPDPSLTPSGVFEQDTGFPFPQQDSAQRTRSLRISMFAVTLIISLPVSHPGSPDSRNGQRGIPRSGSQADPVVLSSSVDSDRHAGWTFVDPVYDSNPQISDVDDHVDLLGQHWDVIARTLMSLQLVVQESVVSWLRKNNPNALTFNATPINIAAASRAPPKFPQPQRSKRILLDQFALEGDDSVRQAVDMASSRVVRGLKIPRVRTGQGRWDVWRDEAIKLNKFAGSKEQNYFMYTLLSAFLGSHTQWLNAFGPKWYRKRHREQRRAMPGEDLTMSSRTLVLSNDKLLARRLVFLLAAFFPGSHPTHDSTFASRPGTSTSMRGYSQSPPMGGSISRQESLRRTINRRDKGRGSQYGQGNRPNPLQPQSLVSRDGTVVDAPRGHSNHSRRPSDTRSLLRSGLIAAAEGENTARKSTATTTPTITAQTLASFSNATSPTKATHDVPNLSRPNSSGSLASENLRHTLQRNNSNASASDSQAASKWGSFRSMWSLGTRRESSTDLSDVLQYPDEGLGVSGISGHLPARGRLQRMVDEVNSADGELYAEDLEESSDRTPAMSPAVEETESAAMFPPAIRSRSRRVPTRNQSSVSPPLKMSVNEKDGVIDVEIPGFSFGSPTDSFLLNNSNAPSSLESSTFGPQSTCEYFIKDNKDARQPVSVSGWIKWVHPDFTLQALNPYDRIEDDVRRAMAAEPTPAAAINAVNLENGPCDKWVEVCSTIIADTRTFVVKRITLRRLVRLIPAASQPPMTPAGRSFPPSKSQWGDVYDKSELTPTELNLKEEFVEERIVEFDQDLREAVERAISQCPPEPRSIQMRGRQEQNQQQPQQQQQDDSVVNEPVKFDFDKQKMRCRDVILGSLDQIAHDVVAQQSMQRLKVTEDATADKPVSRHHSRQPTGQRESVLREGVKKWLREVEM